MEHLSSVVDDKRPEAPPGRKPQIAIVDDDQGFAGYLRTFLALRGFEARSYSRGDEMVAAIRQSDPPDIVLLDVAMPGMDGLQTLRALKSARPELQVIMLSGREQASTIVEAVRMGAADYVVKPDDPEGLGEVALESAITHAMERSRLVSELSDLKRQLSDDEDRAFLYWHESANMRQVATLIERVADSDVTVFIRGESGVGKELVARAIHQRSNRHAHAFVKVNCAALPAELLESELFGHEKGAFTGAASTRIGKFEQAHGGTIFLDEIAEMKAPLQAKLLHVLQDGEFSKLGSNKKVTVDVRVLAATNRDLDAMMHSGEFREDLYYRLKVIDIFVPPLRERRDELLQLTDFFIAKYSRRYNRATKPISDELRQVFLEYWWPGNVRELENMIKRLVILQDEYVVMREIQRTREAQAPPTAPHAEPAIAADRGVPAAVAPRPVAPLPAAPVPAAPVPLEAAAPVAVGALPEAGATAAVAAAAPAPSAEPRRLADVARDAALAAERAVIEQTLRQVHWNRRKAAQLLGVSYKTLLNKIKECGIRQ